MYTKENTRSKQLWLSLSAALVVICAVAGHYLFEPWQFYRTISPEEAALRMQLVCTAEKHLGAMESDGSHLPILDTYNSHEPLAVGYVVQPSDSWCATFVSTAAIESGLTDIIPTECGCERQITLFQDLGRWQENESYVPLPGDIIYYDWDESKPGDCTGWSDHVGIVVGTKWPFAKVIEGNKDDSVSYRILYLGDIRIRGYGLPDYGAIAAK